MKNQKRSTVTGCEDAYLNIIMFKIHRNYSPQRREIDSKQYFSPQHTVWSLVRWIDLWWNSATYHTWKCRTFPKSNVVQIWMEWDERAGPGDYNLPLNKPFITSLKQEHCGTLRRSAFTLQTVNTYKCNLWRFCTFKIWNINLIRKFCLNYMHSYSFLLQWLFFFQCGQISV